MSTARQPLQWLDSQEQLKIKLPQCKIVNHNYAEIFLEQGLERPPLQLHIFSRSATQPLGRIIP